MRATTWWDHETESIWSQPWGLAIVGPLKGTQLELIPANTVSWATWLADHPDTLFMDIHVSGFGALRELYVADFVIGVSLGGHAKAYRFREASVEGIINDQIGPFPVVVLADDGPTKAVYVYLRRAGDKELEFELRDGRLVDLQTGSRWDRGKGVAVDGPLRGELLKQLPWITSFDWAWKDFFPHSEFYGEGR